MIEIRQYVDRSGRNPFNRWFAGLEVVARARVTIALERLENGNLTGKSVGAGVLELRLDFGPGFRVYFGRDGDVLVILLAGGTKRRQQADIEAAKLSWRDYKSRRLEE